MKISILFVAGMSGAVLSCTKAQEAQKVIRVTGIPDENPTELQRRYQPMVRFLENALGAKVKYIPVTDYGAAVQAMAAGRVDFAWLGGFTFVQARSMAKVEPLVMRAIDRDFKSVFISTTLKEVKEIKGKRFAFGSKSSTSGHLMPRYFLEEKFGINPERDFSGEPIYSGAHDATAKIVASGQVDAGALNKVVWDRLVQQKKIDPLKVKVIHTTEGYVDYVWAVRKEVPQALKDAFRRSFLALDAKRPTDREVLQLQGAKRFVLAKSEDFDPIERVAKSTGLLKR